MSPFSCRLMTAATALVLAGVLAGNAAASEAQVSGRRTIEESVQPAAVSAAAPLQSAPVAAQTASKPPVLERSKAALSRLNTKVSAATRHLFERASAAFPSFCEDWERKLRERERHNLSSIKWQDKSGWKIGYYVGYGKILLCQCEASTRGMPVGKLKYQETNYYLAGKTIDEALHALPKATDVTITTELFRWGKDNWVY